MKRLLIVILIAAGLWSGYWFVGATGAKSGFEAWFEARRAEGWVADYTDFSLRGFPNRFDASWDGLTLADPQTGVAVDMPFFQVLALSYRPTHVIAVAPQEMQVSTPYEKFGVASDDLRASLRLRPNTSLELENAVLHGDHLRITGAQDAALRELRLAAERTGDTTYRYGVEAFDLSPPAPVLQRLAGQEALPEVIEVASLDATVSFDKPWDISALEVARPQPTHIDLSDMRAIWGVMEFRAAGEIEVDAQGLGTGTVNIRAENWRDMLRVAVNSGAVPENAATATERALGMLAGMKGNPNSIDATLELKNGQVFIGFIPLGPAPVFRLR